MSLPTTIKFLNKDLRWVSVEFYNAGWWVPDDVGKDIASLYQDEEGWEYVVAYGELYNHDGYPVGVYDHGEYIFYAEDECAELKDKIDNPPKREDPPPAEEGEKGKIGNVEKMLMPIIRKVAPKLMAEELVGVQPMTGDSIKDLYNHIKVTYDSTPFKDKREYFTGDTSLHRLTEGDSVKILRPMHKDFEETNDKIGTITNRDGEYLSITLEKSGVEVEQYPNEVMRLK